LANEQFLSILSKIKAHGSGDTST